MKIISILCLLATLLNACNEDKPSEINAEIIALNPNHITKLKRSDIFEFKGLINIPASAENIMGDISDMVICDEGIILNDGTLSLYSAEGKFVRKIGNTGRGPGETISNQICHFGAGILTVLDYSQEKVVQINVNGKIIKESFIDLNSQSGFVFQNNF